MARSTIKNTATVVLCSFLILAFPMIVAEETASQSTAGNVVTTEQVNTTPQIKYDPSSLFEIMHATDAALNAFKNSMIVALSIIQKYGKSLPNKEEVIKALEAADAAHTSFLEVKIRSILNYMQQDIATIPTEAYPEICGVYNTIIRHTTQLLDAVESYAQSNFTQDFDYSFLTTKDALIIDETVTPEIVKERALALIEKTKNLDATSSTIGLTRWNKIARKIDKYAVQPCFKYHVPEITGVGLLIGIIALYNFWLSHGEHHELEGDMDRNNAAKESIEDNNERKLFPKLTRTKQKENKIPENSWLGWLLKKMGPIPARTIGNVGSLDGAKKTIWNVPVCWIHNILNQDPIPLALWAGLSYTFKTYVLDSGWAKFKNSVHNWWQEALGGRNAEMELVGTFEIPSHKIRINFEDVVGLDHIKEKFRPAIEYARNPQNFAQFGGKIATNYVLYGPKRTGKSHFAFALAGEMTKANKDMKFLKIPCALFHVKGVEETIEYIKSMAPCIAFIDEVDIGGFNRAIGREATGNLLMALGEGNISPSPDRPVFLVFATNKLEALDTSLVSLGRFGATVLFTAPSFIDRIRFIEVMLRSLGHNPNNFDIQRIAEKTDENSFEEIKFGISAAMVEAKNNNLTLTTELILNVMNEMLHGLYKEFPYELHAETIDMLATHFAGRALVTALTEQAEILDTVSICKRKLPLIEDEYASYSGKQTGQRKYEYGALFTRQSTTTDHTLKLMGPKAQKAHLMGLVAGYVAEEMIFGECTYACDVKAMQNAYQIALMRSGENIMFWFDQLIPDAQRMKYFEKAEALIQKCKDEARTLLTQHRQAFDVITRALKMFGTLDDAIVRTIIENPADINARLDELQKQREEEYKRIMEQQQAPAPQEAA